MNPFNKLVQNKRGKMLVLAILLTAAVLARQCTGINLTYIVKTEDGELQPSCIAEENERYAGIGWVYPLAAAPRIATKFVPTIRNDYNCKFDGRDKCAKSWALKNWQIDANSTRTLDLLFDSRWEDLPAVMTANGTKEFADRVEVPSVFRAGLSLRAADSAELLVCDGWNPYNYPCYHLNMSRTEIFLRKYTTLRKNISSSDRFLDSYKAFANILSDDEWRNFVVSLDDKGVLSLVDVSVNRTVIQYEDKEPLKPAYLHVRSTKPALWKFHQNHFFYTKTPQISRLGPMLYLPSKDLCVALYVSTCDSCAMTFFITRDGAKKVLKDVEPTKDGWQMIKLKSENILSDNLNIFVETKFAETSGNRTEGFWAVDDVRVCHENEVKVTFLKLSENGVAGEGDDVACQVVQHPKWRPKKLVYPKIQDFPTIDNSSNSTSITLNWTQEDPHNQINYLITYQANDLCPAEIPNLKRIKSNGFLMTKYNEITINNLVPYTKYNITFSSMLHEKEKQIYITTQESEQPSMEELPAKLNIQVKDTQAFASWDKIPCASIYGPVLYSMKITNTRANTTKELNVQTDNTVQINDLQPYTPYTLYIATARNFESLQSGKNTFEMNMKFLTQPGKAPAVRNFEVYSTDKNSVSLRYDLPENPGGRPVYSQVFRCNAITFKKCKSAQYPIVPCKLWPKKYCVDIQNLIPGQKYTFKMSVRNEATQFYGDEVKAEVVMAEQVPGAPTNLTYKVVDCKDALDYCHLNISWYHPYRQNGTIESFHMVLNASDNGTSKDIQEVLQIFNASHYLPKYEYQIKYIPYSTHYELYVQSVNSKYKSDYVHTHVKTDDVGDHIDQSPTLLTTGTTSASFKLPVLDHRLTSYTVTIVVQDFNKDNAIAPGILKNTKVADHLCHNFGTTWILKPLEVTTNETKTVDIGNGEDGNERLQPKTQYCFTFIVTNKYKNAEHDVVYYKKLVTADGAVSHGGYNYHHLYILLLLLLLVPVGFLAYRYFKKRRPRKNRQQENKENVYESLPFEECEENCVTNDTYDHLLHK